MARVGLRDRSAGQFHTGGHDAHNVTHLGGNAAGFRL